MKVAEAARRHGEVLARRRVGCRGGTGTVRRRRSVINCAWSDGEDGGRRAWRNMATPASKGGVEVWVRRRGLRECN
ncbi:hypothetical protein U1Q18_016762 [Sarracenia purpurea var. burkii]